MKRWILGALLGSALLAGALLAWSSQEAPPQVEPDLEDFKPTENVPADSSVSFPVDI
jgi:hypothetical protein